MYTWGEIQIETCKKMFLNSDYITVDDLDNLRINNNYKTYFNGMAQAANEGISEILKRGKPYIKTYNFVRKTNDNLLGNRLEIREHTYDDITFETDKGKSYYFEIDGYGEIDIYVGEELAEQIIHEPDESGFNVYKNFLDNDDNLPVRLVFKGDHPYKIRNVCVYGLDYNYGGSDDTDNIPNYTNENTFNLKDEISDFYKIVKFYYNGREMINNTDYKMIDHYTLIINDMTDGEYTIKYQPYVEKIDNDTDDSYELPLEHEMAVLLPLYMASELYKDDDLAMSTMYRNEFEAMVDDTYPTNCDLKFISKSGWL